MIWRQHIHKVALRLPDSWSNWNLEMLVFEERGKPEYPVKNLSEQRRKPTTNSTHIWRRGRDLNPGHTGWRRALSRLRHPLLPCAIPCFSYTSKDSENSNREWKLKTGITFLKKTFAIKQTYLGISTMCPKQRDVRCIKSQIKRVKKGRKQLKASVKRSKARQGPPVNVRFSELPVIQSVN